jgi:hypothetical protein
MAAYSSGLVALSQLLNGNDPQLDLDNQVRC